jgi:hypothetical protein
MIKTGGKMNFDIAWSDLTYSKQQDIIDSVKRKILEDWEGEAANSAGNYPKEWTWQMFICSEYSFENIDGFEYAKDAERQAELSLDVEAEVQAEREVIEAFGFGRVSVEV